MAAKPSKTDEADTPPERLHFTPHSVVLYLKNKIRPETLLAIQRSKPGQMIPVEESEMNAFQSLIVWVPEDDPGVAAAKAKEKRDSDRAE